MALVKCSECEKKISDKASFCPHCGYSNKPYTFCKFCGAKTTDGNFCTNCGISLNATINYATPIKEKTLGIALAGGITGICSFIDLTGITAIVAIVLSSIGLSKTKDNKYKGKGWSICGLVCGIVALVLAVLYAAYL